MRESSTSEDLEVNLPTSLRSSISGEIQDLIMSSDGEIPDMIPLPPHVAARFYRPTNTTRRKSSAASSRHNSISSLHSSKSNRCGHGGAHSTHVAQHLRRASILETRKARLAEKAAHAEKVRLRAAVAKATPRASTNTEERALAAQRARERYLAQVAARCAEEVERAKKVAEDMKEKKAAENLKSKGEMEERLAEAERRRTLYHQNLRRTKTASLPVVEEKKEVIRLWKPKTDAAAARIIQRAWRKRVRRLTVQNYLALRLSVGRIQSTSFEDVGALLSQESVLTSTAKILKLCSLQEIGESSLGDSAAVRVFLSAFLVLGHPKQVLSNDGEQEQDLITKANKLLRCFDQLLSSLPKQQWSLFPAQAASLSEAYATFQTAFSAWKDHDSSILVQTMIAQFVELDAIWQTVKNDKDGGVADDYQEGIQRNQTLLLVRLKRLAGPEDAMKMIAEAVKTSRKSRKKKAVTGNAEPRATSNAVESSSNSMSVIPDQDRSSSTEHVDPNDSIQARELRKITSSIPSNRLLVHELAINRDYRIDVGPQSELRDTINRAVFDSMRSDLEAGCGDSWIVAMAENIRERLLRLVTPGKSLHSLIVEALDPEMVEKQLKIGSFSYEKFFSFMNTILPKLCAPFRDAEVKAFAEDQSADLIDRLARLMHIIDLLSLDYANFLLTRSAPEVIRRSAEYEQECFSKAIQGRRLSKTLRWWSHASIEASADATRRTTDGTSRPPSRRVTPDKIYMQGLVGLAIASPPLEASDVPETLELDLDRLNRMRNDILRIITIGAILLTAKNLLKRDVRSQWKSEATCMWDLPFGEELPPSSYLSVIDSTHTLPPATKAQLSGTVDRVLADAKARRVAHPVTKVLLQKLRTHILTRLSASSAEERLRATTTAGEALASSGLPEFIARVGGLVEELGKVAEVDRGAHGMWYDEAAREVGRGN
ncbi:hypothetical protein MMC20_000620 [Loxospora ochrophaea]|nr:hypothetical protein [Loxospora ochrophaea]